MSEDLVTVDSYRFPAEAEAARLWLEEEGIRTFLADAETVNMDWLLGQALGHVKLQVAASDVARAAEILERLRQRCRDREETEWTLDEDEESPLHCLSCGALMRDESATCPQCGWSYESKAEA